MAEPSSENATKQNKTKQANELSKCSTTCSTTDENLKRKSFVTSIILFGRKVSVRVDPELWSEFKRLARAERITLSEQAERAAVEYVERHKEPNPQQQIIRYSNGKGPYFSPATLESKWKRCIFSTNDYSHGTEYPIPMCNLRRTFVGMDFQRCQNCDRFKKRV